ncbi:MAG: VOC family protein [Gammaproteobacteria bacterium]|nr:VOC family protein [Gammaproteobacteria bacterium]
MHEFTGQFAHVGFAIANLEKTIQKMERILGGGSFQIIDEVQVSDLSYLGTATNPRLKVGIGSINGLDIELIEQSNEAPSPYLEDIKSGLERPNHLAFASSNYDGDRNYLLQQEGEVIFSSNEAGSRFSYIRFENMPGFVVEQMEVSVEAEGDLSD